MARKEYAVIEILDILRRYQAGDSIRKISKSTGLSRNTLKKYIEIAEEQGFSIDAEVDLHEVAFAVFSAIHRDIGHTGSSKNDELLLPYKDVITHWLSGEELTLTKVHIKLQRQGVGVSYIALYRFVHEHLGFGKSQTTVRVIDTEPGEVAEVDFGRLGLIHDASTGKKRVLHALVVTLAHSRHQYVYTTYKQDLNALITGIEEAWEFFDGVTRRVIIDNMRTAVVKANRYEPIFQRTFLEYSQHRGFIIDATVVRHPTGKPKVERQVPYVRENFFKGEDFTDREHVQREAVRWCLNTAGLRNHGTTRLKPRIVFEDEERKALLPLAGERFDAPKYGENIVHPDLHIRFGNALYSVPHGYEGKKVLVRGDSRLVRIYLNETLIKTHPVMPKGTRSTDYDDYPKEKTPYAMRNCAYCIDKGKEVGENCHRFMEKLLSGAFPWSRLRQAQKLIRLWEKYGKDRVEQACQRALSFNLVNVHRVEKIVLQVLTSTITPEKEGKVVLEGRFQRSATYFSHKKEETDNGIDERT